jgi:hypothetical protein
MLRTQCLLLLVLQAFQRSSCGVVGYLVHSRGLMCFIYRLHQEATEGLAG